MKRAPNPWTRMIYIYLSRALIVLLCGRSEWYNEELLVQTYYSSGSGNERKGSLCSNIQIIDKLIQTKIIHSD